MKAWRVNAALSRFFYAYGMALLCVVITMLLAITGWCAPH